MSGGTLRGQFLYSLPSSVLWEFCRVMDGLSDLDWTRFGESEPAVMMLTVVKLSEKSDDFTNNNNTSADQE